MAGAHWTKAAASTDHPPDSWWRALADAGGLDGATNRRAVVHVARSSRNRLAVETARSLIAFLRPTSGSVEVIDPAGSAAEWPGIGWIDLASCERVRIDAVCLRNGAAIPSLWLEDFFLITVTGIAPDPRYGIAGILAGQAGLLVDAGRDDLGAIFEAHRLLAADLNVACGTLRFLSAESESWWAASTEDVSLECAIAAAAGAQPATLPHLRYLAQHEVMTTTGETTAAPYALQDYLPSQSAISRARAWARAARLAWMVRQDVGLAAANLYRIPEFIERRWPGLLPFGKPAS